MSPKTYKTYLEIAREYFPEVPCDELEAIIWEETGFPTFWETEDVEACFRKQLQIAKESREAGKI